MNKLDAISQRSKRLRAAVRLIKTAITGVCACALIVTYTHLDRGSVTYAFDDANHGATMSSSDLPTPNEREVPTVPACSVAAMDEAAITAQFAPPEPETVVYERPGLTAPEGYRGNIVTYNADGLLCIYGTPVTPMTAKTEGVIPAAQQAVADDYFRDAVCIGNSLVVGMQKSGLLPTAFYANIGLNVRQFFEKPFIPSPDGATNEDGSAMLVTAAEALARKDDFKKVYLMFGINELGWLDIGTFTDYYEAIIDTILTIRPDAVIYMQKILPINEAVYALGADPSEYYTNERISRFNAEIASIAQQKQVVLLDPGTAVADASGQLEATATADGIHLSGAYINRWKTYLATHTVPDVDISVFYEKEVSNPT